MEKVNLRVKKIFKCRFLTRTYSADSYRRPVTWQERGMKIEETEDQSKMGP